MSNLLSHLQNHRGLLLPGAPEYVRYAKAGGTCMIDGSEVACTIQCVHCGKHWVPVKGSGRRRGFCMMCNGPVCGDKACIETCLSWQKKLDIEENPRLATQVSVRNPGLPTGG